VASRIARRQFHYRTHVAIGTLVMLGSIIVPALLTLVGFSLAVGGGLSGLHFAAFLGLMGWGLYWHLRYVTRWDPRRLMRVLTVVTLVFGVLSRAENLLGNESFSEELDFPRTLLPPAFRLARAQPVEDFFEDTASLQEQVDTLTKEE
jgi:hypothetical protein